MKRKTWVVVLAITLPAILLTFQNCAQPSRPTTSASSDSAFQTYESDTDPRLDREENEDAIAIGDGKVLYSSAKKAGTTQHESHWNLTNTSDGGYISTGIRMEDLSDPGSMNVLFQKFDEKGELVYSVEIADGQANQAIRAIELPSSYLVVGATLSLVEGDNSSRKTDSMFIELDKFSGKIIQAKRIGNNKFQQITNVVYVDATEPYLLAIGNFYTEKEAEHSGFILKLDLSLTTVWEKKYTLESRQLDLRAMTHVPGKGLYIVGSAKKLNKEHADSLIMRFNDSGYLLDSKVLEGNSDREDFFSDLINTSSELVAVGRMTGNGYNTDGSLMFFDYNLELKNAFMVGENDSPSHFTSGKSTRDGGLILSGKYYDKTDDTNQWYNWLVKLDKNQKIEFSRGFGYNRHSYKYYLHPLTVRKDSGYAMVANVRHSSSSNLMDPYLLLINQFGDIPSNCSLKPLTLRSLVKEESINFKNVSLSENNLNLKNEDIFKDEDNFEEFSPGRNIFCSEEPYIIE